MNILLLLMCYFTFQIVQRWRTTNDFPWCVDSSSRTAGVSTRFSGRLRSTQSCDQSETNVGFLPTETCPKSNSCLCLLIHLPFPRPANRWGWTRIFDWFERLVWEWQCSTRKRTDPGQSCRAIRGDRSNLPVVWKCKIAQCIRTSKWLF